MDQAWRHNLDGSDHSPTKFTPKQSWNATWSKDEKSVLEEQLRNCTKEIQANHTEPRVWLTRARLLSKLGYPDLSVGDVHKAHICVLRKKTEQLLPDPELETLEEDIWQQLVLSLGQAHAVVDQDEILKKGQSKYATMFWHDGKLRDEIDKKLKMRSDSLPIHWTQEEKDAQLAIGHVHVRHYPWMHEQQIRRDTDLLLRIAGQIETLSNGRATLLQSRVKGDEAKDVHGVFATRRIPAGASVFNDPAIFSTSDPDAGIEGGIVLRCENCQLPMLPRLQEAASNPCSTARCKHCSRQCYKAAMQSYHATVCPTVSDAWFWPNLRQGVPPSPLQRLILLAKYLATIVAKAGPSSSPILDPLLVPEIAMLTPNAGGPESHPFTYDENIRYPLEILKSLGIDVLSDLRFDTWVLQTIRHRIDNNAHGRDVLGLYPSMAMCNHSCEANVAYAQNKSGQAMLDLTAKRDIEKGEELTLQYNEGSLGDVTERRYELFYWLGADCMCDRCRREAGELQSA